MRVNEAHHRAVLDAALDAIITIDGEGNVIEFNPAAEVTFGYRREQTVGRSLADLIVPPRLADRHRKGLLKYLATGEGPVLGKRMQLPAVRADGTEFPAEVSITRIGAGDPPLFTGHVRDITHSGEHSEALRGSEERLPLRRERAASSIPFR